MIKTKINNLFKGLEDESITTRYKTLYTLSNDSFYKHIDEVVVNNTQIKATLGPLDMTIIPFDGATMEVASENRIDIIATKHYGKASLWRAIAYINNISDPLSLKEEEPLIIPVLSGLRKFPNPLS